MSKSLKRLIIMWTVLENSQIIVLFSIRMVLYHLGKTIMELIVSAGADHDLQFRFAIFQINHLFVHPLVVSYVQCTVYHARKTHDNMRTNMRVNVRRTELPRRVQVPRYCIVAYDDLTKYRIENVLV